jgi:hypothetical protein
MAKTVSIDLDQLTAEMDALKAEKARLTFELNNISKEIEKRELQFVALLGKLKVKEMQHGIYTIKLKEYTRNMLDQRLLKEKFPEQYQACYLPKVSEKIDFRINK